MKVVDVHEAQSELEQLLERVAAGEEVIISKDGSAIARIVAIPRNTGKRILGSEKGRFNGPKDFDDPLPPEVLALFYK